MANELKILFILIVLCVPRFGMAQGSNRISGIVEDKDSKERIPLVAIQLTELERWTTSDMNGEFNFKNIPSGTYTIQASCLGFEKYERVITISKDVLNYKLQLIESSLGLEEVTIVAKENTSLSSSSKIENTAIEHVQATNLSDIMQLVPGQITLNPDMSSSNQITIRDINTTNDPDDNSAMGTAIIVDGTPISNDANMQTLNTASGGTAQDYSTAGQGVDLRQIPTENIESVEVIRGIPSVEYGNLTTGAVLVKTKAGKTKLRAKIKVDPRIKQSAISKGFLLPGNNNGAVNLDFDYTNSMDDLRKPTKSYKRITGQLGYSNVLFRESTPLSINAKVSYYNTFDNEKNDPDMLREEIIQEKEKNISMKLYGKYSVEKPWLTNIVYNFSGNFTQQEVYEYRMTTNNGATPLPTANTSGEYEAVLLPTRYFSDLTIDGKPYNYFGSIKANITGKYGAINNTFMLGSDWRTSGNNGDGKIYDVTRPPSGATSTRPRAFKDIPASNTLSLYLQDKISIPIGNIVFKAQAGVRYTNLLPTGLFTTDGYTTLEPRVNTSLEIFKNRRTNTLKNLSVRFGFGKTSKTPSMIFLYPDKSYEDEMSFNYYPDLIVSTTEVIEDTSNPDLKPTTNTKFETGVDFNVLGIKVMLTAFKEEILNGFKWTSQYFAMDYKRWNQLEGSGKNPQYNNGEITYTEDGKTLTLPYEIKSDFHSYKRPINNYSIYKKGVEYVIDFGKINAIKTNFSVSGAYYNIKSIQDVLPFTEKEGGSYQGEKFPYVSIFPGNRGNVKQRLNSNFKITTHIPKLKMIFSLNTQLVWIDKTNYYWKDENDQPIAYSLTENNAKIYGQFEGVDKIYIDPIAYFDKNMHQFDFQDPQSFEVPYSNMVKSLDSDYFMATTYPPIWQVNLKLTKEFSNKAKLSFFANNFFNHRPLVKIERTDSFTRRNQTAYFGAELILTL